MADFNPLVHQDIEATLNSIINCQSAVQDAQAKQIAMLTAICDKFGDQIPVLYQLLQSLEGTEAMEKVLQESNIAVLEMYCREVNR